MIIAVKQILRIQVYFVKLHLSCVNIWTRINSRFPKLAGGYTSRVFGHI